MDRKRPNSGKTLAPIFTKKAAPLMAHPNNSNKQERGNVQSYRSQNSGNPSKGRPSKTPSYQQSMQDVQPNRPGSQFSRNNSYSNEPSGHSQSGHRPVQRPAGRPAPDMWGPQPSSFSTQGGPYMPPTPHGPAGDYSPYMDSYRPPDNYQPNYQNFPRQPVPYPYDAPPMYQDPRQYPQYGGGGDGYFPQPSYRPGPQHAPNNTPWNAPPLQQYEEAGTEMKEQEESAVCDKEFEVKKKPQSDCSLHFLTANIQGAKHWGKYLHKIPIMFEIYGVVSSQLTAGKDGYTCSKEFMLKDDKDTMQCVFYQIDRGLPKMIRGRWYRCVGHLQKDKLNCIAVREASDTERKLYKTLISASDRAMREWVANSKEM